MPAFRARPARVSRIDCDDRNAGQFCLVFNESPEFGERPFRHPISLSLPEPCPLADARQLFDGDAAIRVCGLLNDLFRDAVIGVRLKSTLTTREIFQLAPDTFRSSTGSFPLSRFLLKGTAGPSIVLPDVFDLVACVDLAVAVGGDVDNAKIDADEIRHGRWRFVRQIGGDEQKPLSIHPPDEIGLPLGEAESLSLALAHHERHGHATFKRQQRDAINTLERHDATVIGHDGVFSENGLDILVPAVGSADMANAERGHLGGQAELLSQIVIEQLLKLYFIGDAKFKSPRGKP